jgi:hypothetical protein
MSEAIWAAIAGAAGGVMRRRAVLGALPGALLGMATWAAFGIPRSEAIGASGLALAAGWMARVVSYRRVDVPLDGRLFAAMTMGFLLRGAAAEISEIRSLLWMV